MLAANYEITMEKGTLTVVSKELADDDAMAGGRALDIVLGLHSLSGAFGSYLVDGSRVSANTHLLVGGLHRRMGTGSLLLVGEKECAVAVSWAKKGASVACLLWFGEDGTVSCESLNDGSVAVAAPVGAGPAAGATLRIDQAAVAAAFPGISVEQSFPGGVPAKLSLRYGKDGAFSGSFKVYVDSGRSFRQKTVKVSGVVLDGVGYGVAYVKKIGDWKITVE